MSNLISESNTFLKFFMFTIVLKLKFLVTLIII